MLRIQDFRNLKDYHFSVLSLIEKEYVERKAMKKKLEELELQKTELEKETEEKRIFLAQIPNEIKKVSEIMKEFMSIFRLNQSLHPEQHMVIYMK